MTVSDREIALLRIAALRLAGDPFATPVETVRWLTALQAQDFRGGLTSIALRTKGGSRSLVEAALNSGDIVRSWPMRGTLHFVAAEDLGWMLRIAAPRVVSGMAARRRGLEISDADIAHATEVATEALTATHLSRDELFAHWQAAGIPTIGQRGIHLILALALAGVICFGPVVGTAQHVVLVDEWIHSPRLVEHDEGVGEWALRFFRSHGPATVEDFARWTKLPLGLSRAGMAIARPQLERLESGGVERWMDPKTPELLQKFRTRATDVFLLPGFDEFVLGYSDRSTIIDGKHADALVPGNNGVFKNSLVVDGRVIGTWSRVGTAKKPRLSVNPFDRDDVDASKAMELILAIERS